MLGRKSYTRQEIDQGEDRVLVLFARLSQAFFAELETRVLVT